jgi:hypothetical protein
MTENADAGLTDLVKRAERIAATLSDQKLRQITFELVLSQLLRTESISPEVSTGRSTESRHAKRPAKEGAVRDRRRPDDGPSEWVETLFDEQFFQSPKSIAAVVERVKAMGHNILSKDVTFPLVRLVKLRKLRRQRGTNGTSKRLVWLYGNA